MRRPITLAVTLSLSLLLDAPIARGVAADATAAAARPGTAPQPAPRYVRDAQRALRDLGYEPGPVDGIVGPRTREALARYQRSEKIAVTGRLDPETMVRLDIQKRVFPGQARAR
ncbi:MAG TPA: peptidoglycan-binding domain-containing protein [Methylomirabilota bacterium]|nr:peptidoglycan-binding domain-containing protein [Methylomirabilota bacterium]